MNENPFFSNFYNREDIVFRLQQLEIEKQRLTAILEDIDRRAMQTADRMDITPITVKITKDMVSHLLMNKPDVFYRTVDIVDAYFPNLDDEERGRQVKIVSVYLATLSSTGLVAVQKIGGVKGNLYKWNK